MSPCRKCTARCCRYIAFQIDAPKRKHDFENIRWYLAHRKVAVFIEKKKWFIEFITDCKYIGKDHSCTIYHKRPAICREHSSHDCEIDEASFSHECSFKTLEEFDVYLRNRRSKRRKRQ